MPTSHGQKVDLGKDAPVTQEGTGAVDSGSLANESAKKGGDFAENKGVNESSSNSESKSSGTSSSNNASSGATATLQSTSSNTASSGANSSSGTKSSSGTGASNTGSSAGTAPTYVENQFIRDTSGPHGKNLQEGIDYKNTEDGLKKALNAPAGSENDPGRAAEQQFLQNQTRAGRDAGPKEFEVGSKTTFDNLEEKQA